MIFGVLIVGEIERQIFRQMKKKFGELQGWWSRRLRTVQFFLKSKQNPIVPLEGKYQQTI